MVLFPFFTIILLVGFVAYQARGGRPINMRLKGLGVTFELNSSNDVAVGSESKEVNALVGLERK